MAKSFNNLSVVRINRSARLLADFVFYENAVDRRSCKKAEISARSADEKKIEYRISTLIAGLEKFLRVRFLIKIIVTVVFLSTRNINF